MRSHNLPKRPTCLPVLLGLCATLIIAGTAHAQSNYPNKPIRLIIAFGAGAAVDTVSRILGTGLGSLGQPIIVENKPGAAGIVGTEFVARAAPDGYTLLSGATAPFAIVPHLTEKLSYDPVRDFVAVAPFARSASVPQIATVQEEGLKGFAFSTWFGLFAPAGTPRNIVNILNAAVNASFQQPDISDRLKKSAAEKWPGTPEDLAALAKAELEMYGKVARDIGLQKQ